MRVNHLRGIWRHTGLAAMLLLASALTIMLSHSLTSDTAALTLTSEPTGANTMVEPAEAPNYEPGTPAATSAESLRRDNAVLTWTATGDGSDQDTYDIRISQTADVNPATKELSSSPKIVDGLQSASFDMTAEPAGTYFWQVRSCAAPLPCGAWSQVWSMTIDDVAPAAPVARILTKPFDRDVRLGGTGEAGTRVAINVGDLATEAVVATDGTWAAAFGEPFEFGVYEATVTSIDIAGNASAPIVVPFVVKELFVAAQITVEELPVAMEIVPVDETVDSPVVKRPVVAIIDTVNTGIVPEESVVTTAGTPAVALSTDGGVVQSSENGWQVLGLPWFLWAGFGGIVSATWYVTTGRFGRTSIAA